MSKSNDKEYYQADYLLMIFTNKEAANYDTSELVQSTWLLYYSTTNLRWNYFL